MARRQHGEEIAFGSDSFLDVIANMVGILIILIVIAGLRVKSSPHPLLTAAPTPAAQANEAPTEPALPPITPDLSALPPAEQFLEIDTAESDPEDAPSAPQAPPLSQELVNEVERLEKEIRELELQRQHLESTADALSQDREQAAERLADIRKELEEKKQRAASGKLAIEAAATELSAKLQDLAMLQMTLKEGENAQPQPTVIKHKLTPLGREVSGHELHFLLSQGKVAVVPVNELGDELKSHLERKKVQILKQQQYIGSIGPCQGFRMDYIIERQATSLVEELRSGTTVIRAGLSAWQIHPGPGVVWETAQQAIHYRSQFIAALRLASPDTTLTFWVYPDSFGLHRELQEFVQEQGFEVAGRPLPEGIPITGSPSGSRSVAQ